MGGSYNDWLQPSAAELKTIALIEKLITSNTQVSLKAVIISIKKIPLDTLLRFTELSQIIKNYCDKPEQASIWRHHLKYFEEGSFSLQEQRPLSISQLVKGYYFYWLAVERRELEEECFETNELEFLYKSAAQCCFNAYNALSSWALELYAAGSSEHLLLALNYAQEASKYHWTPGYLLAYRICLSAAALSEVPTHFQQFALEALITASKLSEQADSLNAQNNAYFGKGIIEGNNRQFTSWDRAIARVISESKIPVALVNDVYNNASQTAKRLISEFEVTQVDTLEKPAQYFSM